MGIGNLAGALRAYTGRARVPITTVVDEEDLDYVRLYFDSSPARHREAWERLAGFGDDSQTYYWRVLAAREIMRLHRENPAELDRLAKLHGCGPSAELVLHPPDVAERFDEKVAWVKAAAGDRYADLELNCLMFFVTQTDDPDGFAETMAPAFGLTADQVKEVPLALFGSIEQMCDTLEARRERWDFSYFVCQKDVMDQLAPVVAKLNGA